MPSLDRLQQKLGGPHFEVVALSIDRGGVFAVETFYEELDLRALQAYVDPSAEALAKLGAVGIPLTVLVDRSGRELWRVAGPVRWDDPQVVARIARYLAPSRDSCARGQSRRKRGSCVRASVDERAAGHRS
ncbi:MAG: TlpA family protein disulfide reductase [Burkholderiales bacterium]|nr:TlpA family protein disulfide reductase [Burkholderiales bacterium]